jgi:hypothetical protein
MEALMKDECAIEEDLRMFHAPRECYPLAMGGLRKTAALTFIALDLDPQTFENVMSVFIAKEVKHALLDEYDIPPTHYTLMWTLDVLEDNCSEERVTLADLHEVAYG